jgi:hypothetical protein
VSVEEALRIIKIYRELMESIWKQEGNGQGER